jgi:hypothetical protein
MGFSSCKECRRIFNSTGDPDSLCPDCAAKRLKELLELREYLRANPEKTATETSAETGTAVDKLLKYIESGDVDATPGITGEKLLNCCKCRLPIAWGQMCDKCRLAFNTALSGLRGSG